MQQVILFSKLLVFFQHFRIFCLSARKVDIAIHRIKGRTYFLNTGYNLKLVTCGKMLSKRFALREKMVHFKVVIEQRWLVIA